MIKVSSWICAYITFCRRIAVDLWLRQDEPAEFYSTGGLWSANPSRLVNQGPDRCHIPQVENLDENVVAFILVIYHERECSMYSNMRIRKAYKIICAASSFVYIDNKAAKFEFSANQRSACRAPTGTKREAQCDSSLNQFSYHCKIRHKWISSSSSAV